MSSSSVFRLNGRNLFLTYPQCDVPSDFVEGALRSKLKHFEWAVIARENHADGHTHLHCFVHLSKRCDFTTPACLDLVCPGGVTCHGNYQIARDPRASLDYVCKDGDLRFCNTTLEAARACFAVAGRKRTATELIMTELTAGKPLTRIAFDHPEHMTFIMLHMDRLQQFHTRTILDSATPLKKFVRAQAVFGQSQAWDLSIANWLNSNLFKTSRPLGTPQLWIQGPTGCGKTTLVTKLAECCRIYVVPNEDFYDDYCDSNFDLIVFEEFKHQKTVQWMNSFCDGQVCPIRQKGRQAVKRSNLPVIVLSNLQMREAYPNVPDAIFATIARRFTEVTCGERISVELEMTSHDQPEDVISLE